MNTHDKTTFLSVLSTCFCLTANHELNASDMNRLARELARDGVQQAEVYKQDVEKITEQSAPLDQNSRRSIDDIVSRSQQSLQDGGHQDLIEQLENDGSQAAQSQMEAAQQIIKQTEQDTGQKITSSRLSPQDHTIENKSIQGLENNFEIIDPLKLNQKEEPESQADASSGCGQKRCQSKAIQMSNPSAVSQDVAARGHQVLIFVSTSMPKASLQAYSQMADQIGARLILRGLVGDSFQATHQYFIDLGINVDIDPPLFEQFDVTHVPTFIHADVKDGQYVTNGHDRLQGHISVHDALQIFMSRGQIKGADDLLKQIESDRNSLQ